MTRERILGIMDIDDLKRLVRQEIAMQGPHADLNHIDVSGVDRLNFLFENLDFQGDISQWDVSNAVTARGLFRNCPFNGDISKWNLEQLTIADCMFQGSAFNGDISKWKFKELLHTTGMFKDSAFNGDISRWDVKKVLYADLMFENSQFNGDLTQWKFNSAKTLNCLFLGSRFNGDLSNWRIKSGVMMQGMFRNSPFSGDLSSWTLDESTDNVRMLDEHFRGIPPTPKAEPSRNFYVRLFGTVAKFSAYLKTAPFNTAHFDLCLATRSRPVSVSKEDYAWFKEMSKLGLGLGMTTEELRTFAIGQHHKKSLGLTPDTTSFDIGALVDTP